MRIGQRLSDRKLLRLTTFFAIISGLSDRTLLQLYYEVEVCGLPGALSTFILTSTLLDLPQVMVGYHETGRAILLGVTTLFTAHASVFGAPRQGKTTFLCVILFQLIRLNYPCIFLGNKEFEPMVWATMKFAAESMTRLLRNGEAAAAQFFFCTLARYPTAGINFIAQLARDSESALTKAGIFLEATGQNAPRDDKPQQFFSFAALDLLLSLPWDELTSMADMLARIKKLKLSRDELYATAGFRNVLSQLASIEILNLPPDHPACVDLEKLFSAEQKGALYFEAAGQQVGDLATPSTGLAFEATVAAKHIVDPRNEIKAFIVIDEGQQFPPQLMQRAIVQCAAANIKLIICMHDANQLGQAFETTANTGIAVWFSAFPGSASERHLQAACGTKKIYVPSFNHNDATIYSNGVTVTSDDTAVSSSTSASDSDGYGISEKDGVLVFDSAFRDALNDDPRAFVFRVQPTGELFDFGPGAHKAIAGGPPMPFSEVNRIALNVTEESPHTFLPGQERRKQIAATAQAASSAERALYVQKLNHAAAKSLRAF